jgi:cell filamentation protein
MMKRYRKKIADRYDVSALVEAQFEPGSHRRVFKNLLGIKQKREMDRLEALEQLRALRKLIKIYGKSHRFTAADICRIHRIWLKNIYPWAGKYRRVNLTKNNFTFAAANQIVRLMEELEKGPLREFTPCRFDTIEKTIKGLAAVHTELVLIHSFRDGNGRVARLLATLMALQAELPPLDFGSLKGYRRKAYYEAIRAGMDRDYKPMEDVFNGVIRKTLRRRKT